jgi:hypothetical protein
MSSTTTSARNFYREGQAMGRATVRTLRELGENLPAFTEGARDRLNELGYPATPMAWTGEGYDAWTDGWYDGAGAELDA